MSKTFNAAVVLPSSYAKSKASYPVLYLLHGGAGHFRDWLKLTPDKMLVKNLANQYNIIIVMPEGEAFSWYMDSPYDKASQFETHIIKEVIPKIDNTYRTVKNKKGRAITGLSMGGHGALYLSARNPDTFCAASSMFGAMDMNFANSKMDAEGLKSVNERFQKLLGTFDPNSEVFVKNSIMNMIDTIKKNGLSILIDCGVDDFLVKQNRELHQRLVYNSTPHDYIERPGGHSWDYAQNALPYHLLFFQKVFKSNAVTAE
ncbi:alpha/beta hydrolase [Flavobacterium sp. XS2P12]|uniref:alpha/beta hydrolase n=1 Tax=Flavobacterium melibiosi TaxID=3398734 RepID=UPI003A8A6503